MRNIKIITSVLLAGSISFSGIAAELVNTVPAGQQSIGTVSVSGATSLSTLERALEKQAEIAGAKSYRIIAATHNDKMMGVAEIYR